MIMNFECIRCEGAVITKRSVRPALRNLRRLPTNCPDAIALARKFPHRIREKYEIYLSDDLAAEPFGRECIDLNGAVGKIQESPHESLRRRTRLQRLFVQWSTSADIYGGFAVFQIAHTNQVGRICIDTKHRRQYTTTTEWTWPR